MGNICTFFAVKRASYDLTLDSTQRLLGAWLSRVRGSSQPESRPVRELTMEVYKVPLNSCLLASPTYQKSTKPLTIHHYSKLEDLSVSTTRYIMPSIRPMSHTIGFGDAPQTTFEHRDKIKQMPGVSTARCCVYNLLLTFTTDARCQVSQLQIQRQRDLGHAWNPLPQMRPRLLIQPMIVGILEAITRMGNASISVVQAGLQCRLCDGGSLSISCMALRLIRH